MNYKTLLKTLLIGFIIFTIAVFLGLTFNLGQYMQPSPSETTETAEVPSQEGSPEISSPQHPAQQPVEHYEIVDENTVDQSTEQQIRNDCIRASRRAGVTDANIFAVVSECVAMSLKTNAASGDALPIETQEDSIALPTEVPSVEDSLELTKKACKIVADEEQGLSDEERITVIEQCVKANMESQ